ERLEGGAVGVEQGALAGESTVPGELLLGLGLGISQRQPRLSDGVLATDELVEELGAGVIGDKLLEALVRRDELAALVLTLRDVILAFFAPGGPLAVLGEPGEAGLGLLELVLLEQAFGFLELGLGLLVLGGLQGAIAVGAHHQGRG